MIAPACHPPLARPVVPGMERALGAVVAALCVTAHVHAADTQLIVQSSPLAGFQFYAGRELLPDIRVNDALELVRERDNPHDANAVKVLWRGRMLGYVPKHENGHVARQLDRGVALRARVVKVTAHRNPWLRIAFQVFVEL